MYADTHCHLDFEQFESRLPEIFRGMTQKELGFIVIPSVGVSNFQRVESLCGADKRLFMALGLHPFFIQKHTENDLVELELRLSRLTVSDCSRLVAVGEIGLDASCPQIDKQVSLFQAQLELAEKFKLPVLIHARKSNELLFRSLAGVDLVRGGVIHAFSGSYELLMRFVRLGFKIGVGPVITWPGASKTRHAISRAPLESLVLETDAPGMHVSGVSENEAGPFDVLLVFRALLQVRSESEELIRDSLWRESRKLFGI